MNIQLDSKIIKHFYNINQVVKTSFTHYYLRFNGEAASTLKYHTGEDKLSYSKTSLPIHEFFSYIGLGAEDVLFIDSFAVYKALEKKTKIMHGFILDGVLNIVTSNTDIVKKDTPWTIFNDTVTVPIARIVNIDTCRKPFDLGKVDAELDEAFIDISDLIPIILEKKVIDVKNGEFTLRVGKPLFPGLTTKCGLYAYFHYYKEGLFKAHFRIEKEHVCNYHTYIAYAIFD